MSNTSPYASEGGLAGSHEPLGYLTYPNSDNIELRIIKNNIGSGEKLLGIDPGLMSRVL